MSWSRKARAAVGALALAAAAFLQPGRTFADELTMQVPAIGVRAPVESIRIVDGILGTPVAPDNVGALQVAGNLLVVGHRDWSGQLRAFGHLEALQAGDVIQFSDGRAYSVEATTVWDIDGQQDDWLAEIAPTNGDWLTLISCTGSFSLSRHEYLQRVVVRAQRIQ